MNKRNEAGLIYDYVVTGLTQAEIADTYGTDQWGGVSGTLQYYGFYDGTKGGYRRRFARGLYGLTVTEQMIYDFIKQYSDGDDYYFEDFVKDNQAYYAKKQGKTTQAEAEKKRKAEEDRQRKERERQQQEALRRQQEYQDRQERERQARLEQERRQRQWEEQQRQLRLQEEERRRQQERQNRWDAVVQAFEAENFQRVYDLCTAYRSRSQMDSADLWFKLGYACHCLKRYNEAINAYDIYAKMENDWTNRCIARSNAALCLVELGREEEALDLLRELRNDGYRDNDVAQRIRRLEQAMEFKKEIERAMVLYRAGDYEHAYQLFKSCISHNIPLKEHLFQFAYSCAELGKDGEALNSYTDYLLDYPKDKAALNNRAILWEKLGDPKMALDDLSKAYSLGQRDGNIVARMERLKKKIEEAERQKKVDEQKKAAQDEAKTAFTQKQYDRVIRLLEPWVSSGLGSYEFKYAFALAEADRVDEAIASYSRYIREYPKDTAPLNNRAILWQKKDDPDRALEDLEKAYELGQRDFNIEARMERLRNEKETRRKEQERRARWERDRDRSMDLAANLSEDSSEAAQEICDLLGPWWEEGQDLGDALPIYGWAVGVTGKPWIGSGLFFWLSDHNRCDAAFYLWRGRFRSVLWDREKDETKLDEAIADLEKNQSMALGNWETRQLLTRLRREKEALEEERRRAEEERRRQQEEEEFLLLMF